MLIGGHIVLIGGRIVLIGGHIVLVGSHSVLIGGHIVLIGGHMFVVNRTLLGISLQLIDITPHLPCKGVQGPPFAHEFIAFLQQSPKQEKDMNQVSNPQPMATTQLVEKQHTGLKCMPDLTFVQDRS